MVSARGDTLDAGGATSTFESLVRHSTACTRRHAHGPRATGARRRGYAEGVTGTVLTVSNQYTTCVPQLQ